MRTSFFDAMTEAHRDPPTTGTPRERLEWYFQRTGEVWVHRAEFLRLLILLVISDEATEAPEAMETVAHRAQRGSRLPRAHDPSVLHRGRR